MGRAGGSQGRRMRCAAAGLLLALLLAALGAASLALLGCGDNTDPFAGLYWEPSSARRIEIRKDGDKYWLYYGVDKQPFRATRDGDELHIAQPMGADIIVRSGPDEGTLEMVADGETTLLKPLPEHQ
jgi:hypothetical protein